MKSYYLIPTRSQPKFALNEAEIVKMDNVKKSAAFVAGEALERKLNGGKSLPEIWEAYKADPMNAANPCAAWTVNVETHAQAYNWSSFINWPCNKD